MKTREVPDTLNYALITLGLLGGLIIAITYGDIQVFLEHLAGFVAAVLLAAIMFYGRQWGGGDAKLIMGIGAIYGLWFGNYQLPAFLILLILLGAFYGFVYMLFLAGAHWKTFRKAFTKKIRTRRVHQLRKGLVGTGILILLLIIIVPVDLKILLALFLAALYLMIYSWVFLKTVEESILIKQYKVADLTEGDWIIEEVKKGKKVIVEERNTGVTKEQIKQLTKAKIKKVLVKEGIPFVPAFLLAFLALHGLQILVKSDVFLFLLG